jgi:hypothetical protein
VNFRTVLITNHSRKSGWTRPQVRKLEDVYSPHRGVGAVERPSWPRRQVCRATHVFESDATTLVGRSARVNSLWELCKALRQQPSSFVLTTSHNRAFAWHGKHKHTHKHDVCSVTHMRVTPSLVNPSTCNWMFAQCASFASTPLGV